MNQWFRQAFQLRNSRASETVYLITDTAKGLRKQGAPGNERDDIQEDKSEEGGSMGEE